jgi:hypothetical protein
MPTVHTIAGELWLGKTAISLDDAEWLADVLLDEYRAAWGQRGNHVQRQAIASRFDAVMVAVYAARNWRRASGCVGGRV